MSSVDNKCRGTPDYYRVYAELLHAAEYRGWNGYQNIAVLMGLPLQGSHMASEVGHVLGEISEDEKKAGRPMLSAVVVGATGKPGKGVFWLARQLGRLSESTTEEESFWRQELEAVYGAWKRPLTKLENSTI
jgi:hypothetical protein